MNQAIERFTGYITDPKRKLERLLELSTIFISYIFIFVYQNVFHIQVKLIDFETLIKLPIIALVVMPLVHYLIVKQDALQLSPSKKKAIRFSK